jgi:predicted ATPase
LELCSELPDTSEHLQTEIVLSMALGAQLVALGEYTSVELEQVYTRAQQLCQDLAEQLDEPLLAASQLIPVLLEFGGYHGHRAQYQAAGEIYDQILALAQAAGDPKLMMLTNWGPGYLLFTEGKFLSARSHLEKALEAYEVYKHQEQPTIFTMNIGVSCLSWLSCTSFLLGFPDQALFQSRQAITLARKVGHPLSLAVALAVAALLQSLMLDAKRTQALAEEAIVICREKGFLYWLSVSIAYRGLALAWQDEYEVGISQMKEGEATWRASGAYIGMAEYLITLGEVLGNSGQVDEGLRVLEEAFEMIQQSGEEMYASELYRTKGLLLLKLSNENQAEVEACFLEAIKIAKNQQAKILELRATTSLSGLLVKQGRNEEAREMLAMIYSWFTEGFGTQDLLLASHQLAELD